MPEFTLPHHHHAENHLQETKEQLDKTEDFQMVADVFKQLDDTSRLRIFWLLCHMEECVNNIASLMEMTTPAVSHHLKQLKSSGLIVSRRNGKEVYYKAADTSQSRLLHKMIEQLMSTVCPKKIDLQQISEYQSEQVAIIRSIHDYLLDNLDSHITIDALSKQFLMNPTTLKNLFKEVYGRPIAAHMKEHRMKNAANLLKETDNSISFIAKRVGYENQSKFSAAFKAFYHMTPNEYRSRA